MTQKADVNIYKRRQARQKKSILKMRQTLIMTSYAPVGCAQVELTNLIMTDGVDVIFYKRDTDVNFD